MDRRSLLIRWGIPLFLFTLVLSACLLTYSGRLTSADELSMLAVTENLVERGAFDTDQLAWAVWEHGWMAQGTIGSDGHVYSKKGIGTSLLITPLFVLARLIPGLGVSHTALLLNPFITALTAITLFGLSRRLGYPDSVGFGAGLIVGIATIAWPYSKTLYQEPVAGFCFVAAIYFVIGRLNTRNVLAASALLALAILLKMTNALVTPIVALYVAYRLCKANGVQHWRTSVRQLMKLAGAPMLALGASIYFNWLRFGTLFDAGYSAYETFSVPLSEGLWGLLFSPNKSFLVFSPILMFSLIGLPLMLRRFKAEAVLLLATIVANVLLFARWYDWAGGVAWGPRFLVPLTPLFAAIMLPLFHQWLFVRRGWRQWILIIVLLVSVGVQLVATLVPFADSLVDERWPIGTAFLALNPERFAVAWLHTGYQVDWLVISLLGGTTLLSLFLGIMALRGATPEVPLFLASVGLTLITAFAAIWGVSRIFVDYRLTGGDDYRAMATYLAQHADRDDVIVVDNHIYTEFFLNYDHSLAARYGFLRSDYLQPEARSTLERLLSSANDIWLVSDRPVYSSLPKPEETWLNQYAFQISEEAFSDYARVIRYHHPSPGLLKAYPALVKFDNGAQLVEYEISEKDKWQSEEVINLALTWQPDVVPLPDFNVSVQLLRFDGKLVWQYDAMPAHNTRPSSSWQQEEHIIDRYGIPLPADLAPGEYQLLVVLYNPLNGQRATIVSPANLASNDALVLKSLYVQSRN